MALLYGRAGCLTAKNGGFRPGQDELLVITSRAFLNEDAALPSNAEGKPVAGWDDPVTGGPRNWVEQDYDGLFVKRDPNDNDRIVGPNCGAYTDTNGVEVTGYDCVDYKYLPQGSQSSGGNGVSLAMMDAPNVENRISSTETYLYADHDTVCSLLTVCEPCQFESASGPARGR